MWVCFTSSRSPTNFRTGKSALAFSLGNLGIQAALNGCCYVAKDLILSSAMKNSDTENNLIGLSVEFSIYILPA